MFGTGAAWVAVFFTDWYLLRPHFAPSLLAHSATGGLGHGGRSWVVDSWVVDASGRRLSDADWNAILALHAGDQSWNQAGYTNWMLYEPGSRFWSFQAIDATWLSALAAVCILTTLWWLRRRPT